MTLAVIAAAGAGCGNAGPKANGGTTTPTRPYGVETVPPGGTSPASATTTTTVDPTAAAILAGYRAEEAAFYAAASQYPVDPFDSRLAATMTGAQLVAVRNRLTLARHQGQHAVGTVDLAPMVIGISGTTATISDCLFDHGRIVDGRTGQTVSGPDTQRTLEKVTMQLETGTWKVAGDQKVGSGCVPGA